MTFKTVVTIIAIVMSSIIYAAPRVSAFTGEQEQAAIIVLDRLANIPQQPKVYGQKNREKLMKMRVASVEISRFALSLKGIHDGMVFPKDRVYALALLKYVMPDYADQHLGNRDGVVQIKEVEAFRKKISASPGLQMLLKMWEQHQF